MRTINSIVIHCSATPEGKNFTAADIDAWHRKRNFSQIGYHYVIRLDGLVEEGRPIELPGAHCIEQSMNRESIGICYIGGCTADGHTPKDTRTLAQQFSIHNLVSRLRKEYSIPADRIFGHRDFAAKACPSFDVHDENW